MITTTAEERSTAVQLRLNLFEAATPTPIVMAGLDPAIPGIATADIGVAEGVDHRDKPGDGDGGVVTGRKVSGQLLQQCLRLFEIGRVEAFGEPVVDRRE